MKYAHFTDNEDLGYCLREEVLEYSERKLLYLFSELNDDYITLGCSEGVDVSRAETRTAYVKGYIVSWKCAKDEKGADVSELEAIPSKEQEMIKQLVRLACDARFIYFD